jgi:hypothetical protein
MDPRVNDPRVAIVTFDSARILDVTGPLVSVAVEEQR